MIQLWQHFLLNMTQLGALEKKVMETIWTDFPSGSFSVREVCDTLSQQQEAYAYNTILTVITHLFEKKFLSRKKNGKTHFYSVRISRAEHVERLSQQFFKQLKQEYGNLAVAHFANIVESIDPTLLEKAKKEAETADSSE